MSTLTFERDSPTLWSKLLSTTTYASCRDTFSTKDFCQNAASLCKLKHNSETCLALPQRGAQPSNEVVRRVFSRTASPDLKKQVLGYAKERFNELVHSEDLLEACCGKHSACRRRFSETALNIVHSSNRLSENAFYSAGIHQIVIDEPRLLNVYNEEGIDWVLLHELGHSCQATMAAVLTDDNALGPDTNKLYQWKTNSNIPMDSPTYERLLGKGTSDCIRSHLKMAHADTQSNLLEAFADAMFAFKMNSPFHWARSCKALPDSDHAAPTVYMGCILGMWRVREALCMPGSGR